MRPPDVLMKVGEGYYPHPGDFMAEAMGDGASKRLPGVPTGAVQDVTRVFLVHPKAFVQIKCGTVRDVLRDLKAVAKTNDQVRDAFKRPSPWHTKADILVRIYATKNKKARAVLRRYGVSFWPGIFGYFYMAQIQGVVDSEETDLDPVLKEAGVVPVFVVWARGGQEQHIALLKPPPIVLNTIGEIEDGL